LRDCVWLVGECLGRAGRLRICAAWPYVMQVGYVGLLKAISRQFGFYVVTAS